MSTIGKGVNGSCDPFSQNKVKTKFWGLTCVTGLKYHQRIKKKYYVTQAVLDPDSHKKDDASNFVSVMVEHDEEEHIMAVLKHGEIYQVILNMLFDRENVTFYIKGNGTVNLLGYEVVDPEDVEDANHSPKDKKVSKMKSESSSDKETFKSKKAKGVKKAKKLKQEGEDEEQPEPNYINELLERELEDSSDEEDADFSVGDEESDVAESDEDDEDGEEEESEESDVLDEENVLEYDRDQPGPSTSQKRRKRPLTELNTKRSKLVASSAASSSKSPDTDEEDSSSESSGKASELLRKKRMLAAERKKLDDEQTKIPRILDGGVEVTDIRIGSGPLAENGKLLHVYYIGRLPDKKIFDSVLPRKKPFSFRLGAQKVIKGWEIGLPGMKVGGKRKLKVPSSLGYGNKSIDGIPPNSTLYFTIELQGVS